MKRSRTSKIWLIHKDELQNILDTSKSKVEVLEKLGYDGYNGNHRTLLNRIIEEGLDETKLNQNRENWKKSHVKNMCKNNKTDLKDILKEKSNFARSHLKRKLIEEEILEYKCSECGISEWNGKEISLQLDHINGVNNDNRIENLRFLCPNCHSQTETFSGKRHKKWKLCIDCGKEITSKSLRCRSCSSKKSNKKQRKFEVEKEELEKLLTEMSLVKIGKSLASLIMQLEIDVKD